MSGIDVAVWAWPQWTYAAMFGVTLILHAALDGKPRTGNYQFSVTLVSTAIGFCILWAGGYWA